MLNVHPKTYNEALSLSKCLECRKYVSLPDEKIEEMYNFLIAKTTNKIVLTSEMLMFVNESGETESATVLDSESTVGVFDRILLSGSIYNLVTYTNSSGSSCGGCSSNNNNNNNNNNNG